MKTQAIMKSLPMSTNMRQFMRFWYLSHVQKPLISALAYVSSGARGLNFESTSTPVLCGYEQ